MGNRAECPACKSYSSSILADINEGNGCRVCGCPHSLLVEWKAMQPILEKLREGKFEKSILERLEKLEQENAQLKTKIKKMYDLLAWLDLNILLEPIIKVKELLEEE